MYIFCLQVPTYHLVLEGFLFLWILWLLARRYQRRGQNRGGGGNFAAHEIKLTKEEEEELLAEWKPEPLVPTVLGNILSRITYIISSTYRLTYWEVVCIFLEICSKNSDFQFELASSQ